jgi:transposase
MQSLRRARGRPVGERTALVNRLRAFLLERGIAVPKGRHKLEVRLEGSPEAPAATIGGTEAAGVVTR